MAKMFQKMSKKIISTLLIVCLLTGMFPIVTVQAAEIKGGDFNPIDKNLSIDFRFDLTQRATIEVFVDGVSKGCLMRDHEITGSVGTLAPREPCASEYYHAPRAINDYVLPSVSISETEGQDSDGNSETHILLDWDGRIDGIPVIGADPSKDECVVVIEIRAEGYPERNKPCEDIDDGSGGTTHVPGENWTWTTDPDWIVSVAIYVDYKAIFEGADPDTAFLMVKGGTSYKITCEMDEVFRGNSALIPAFEAYMNTDSIASVEVAEPVNMVDGNFTFSYPDLRVEGAVPLTFLRTYSSIDKDGAFGQGFTHGYEYSLFDDDGIIRVTLPYGEEVRFLRRADGTYHGLQNQGFVLENSTGGYTMTHEYGAEFSFSTDGKLEEIRNPAGVTVAAMSYAGDNLTRITGIAGVFDLTWDNGHITRVTDQAGRSVAYAYSENKLISVTNPDGDTLTYSYDDNGYVSSVKDFEGKEYVRNTYDEKGRVTEQIFTNADVETETTFSYDDVNRVNTFTDSSGWVTKYYYDEYRNVIAVEDKNGAYANTYDNRKADSATDNQGNCVSYEFDSNSRVTKISYPDGTSAALSYARDSLISSVTYADGSVESYSYDDSGNIIKHTDQNGNVTSFTYNALGLPLSEINALGGTTSYAYDAKGRLLSVTDPEGGETRYDYDEVGRITASHVKISDSETATTEYTYSPAGKLLKVKDALGNETAYTYNGNGFTTSTTDALGGVTSTEYGTNGQPLKQTDANGNETVYSYNSTTALLESVTDPEGNATTYTYNDRGLLTETTDAAGNKTKYEYDSLDRLTKTTDALGGTTSYEYDVMGRTVSATDANGGKTSYTYDKLGRLTKTTDPEDGSTSYTYDPVGNLLVTTDANGNTTSTEYNALNYAVKSIDGEGNETSYEYDKAGRMVKVTDALGGVTSYTYDLAGNMLSTTDPNGNVSRYVYDLLGRTVEQINADNTSVKYTYDALSRVIESLDERGGRTSYTYDANGNRLTVTDPMGYQTAYAYNGNNQVTSITYADGGVVLYAYSPLGAVAQSTDQLGGVTSYTYDKLGRQKTVTDAESHVTEYFYDPIGNVLKTTIDGHTVRESTYDKNNRILTAKDGLGSTASYTYDPVGNLTTYTDREGNATEYSYNKNYQVVQTKNALGGTRSTEYDALGRAVKTTDENGNSTATSYDLGGNILTVTDALSGTFTYTYDARNRVTAMTDKLGATTAYRYDEAGNIVQMIDANGGTANSVYDANNNLIHYTNRVNEWMKYDYDNMNRLVKETNQLNHATAYEYDLAGNRTAAEDGNHNKTTYVYDGLHRLISEKNAEGGELTYTYNYLGNIATLTADGGNGQRGTTTFTYDAAGNRTKETSPLGYTTTYTYDKEGNVLTKTDENGKTTTYEYDKLYRLTKRADGDGTASYAYDAVGNLISAEDASGTVAFTYDALYRATQVTNEDGTETTAYTYDANGSRLSITYPDGKAVATAYDPLGNVTKLTDYDGTGITYTRDAEGRVIKESHSDGGSTEYDYNAAGLLTMQKEVTRTNTTRRQIVYTYDDAGNLTSENRSGVDVDKKDELVRYYYDKAGQLTKTTIEGVTKSYAYDLAGNLLSDGENTYTYDLQNRLTQKSGPDGTVTYEYNAAGNLIKETSPDGATSYAYNAQNRLVKGEKDNGESSSYKYNALGARVERVEVRENKNAGHQNARLNSGSARIKDYTAALSDGRAIWQRSWETEIGTVVQNNFETVTKHYVVDYLSVANRDIMVTEDGSFTQRYVYDGGGKRLSAEFDYADGTKRGTQNANGEYGENPASDIAVNDVGKVWYHTSLLNSTLFAVDKGGEVIAHMIYDPWGNPLTEAYTDTNYSGLDNLNNYTGYTWDVTLGLYFAQNRFYDAANHRFTQEDVIKDGGNWYVYCGNNPIVETDFYGLMKLTEGDFKYIYHYSPSGNVTVDKQYRYGWPLEILQKWLVYLGYLNEVDVAGHYGENYGGKTIAAVQLFQLNYGLPTTNYTTDSTYLAVANAVVLKKYGTEQKRINQYNINVNSVRAWDEYIYSTGYYRKYQCEMIQQIQDWALYGMSPSVTRKKINGIYYLDYTSVINTTLDREIQEFFDHRIRYSYAEYIEEYSSWFYFPEWDTYFAGCVFPNMLWFKDQVKKEAKWDLKLKTTGWDKVFGSEIKYYSQQFKFVYEGEVITSEDLGNITYGYLGSAMGFSADILHLGAQIAGKDKETEQDTLMINKGISKFFKKYGNAYPVKY